MSTAGVPRPYELLGASPAVADAVAQLARAARDDRGVLITAEPGLDAEAVARALHHRSPRRSRPFVALACDGASAAALEKQLLGGPQPARAASAAHGIGSASGSRISAASFPTSSRSPEKIPLSAE